MAKRSGSKKAKDKAWSAFSNYIRTRDCLRFTGDIENGVCITCKRQYPFNKLQAGHFIDGRGNSVLFDERIVYTQCYSCNVMKRGNYIEYFVWMEQEWGRDTIDEFRRLKKDTKIYKEYDFLELERHFKEKAKELISK